MVFEVFRHGCYEFRFGFGYIFVNEISDRGNVFIEELEDTRFEIGGEFFKPTFGSVINCGVGNVFGSIENLVVNPLNQENTDNCEDNQFKRGNIVVFNKVVKSLFDFVGKRSLDIIKVINKSL